MPRIGQGESNGAWSGSRPSLASRSGTRQGRDKHSGMRLAGHRFPRCRSNTTRRSSRIGRCRSRCCWLIGVNSCTGNRWAWDAAGSVGPAQLERLARLLGSLTQEPRILITHYPVGLADGRRERKTHGLRDLDALVKVAAEGGVCLWLHGHRHHTYQLVTTDLAPFPVVCSGSATQTGCWSYGEYGLDLQKLHGQQRVYDLQAGCFRDGARFELNLPTPITKQIR